MFGTAQSVAAVATSVALAVCLLLVARRVRGPSAGRAASDAAGWHVGLIGTSYAVIVAFMLAQVWTSFGAAAQNAAIEATSLASLFRVAEGLPAAERRQLQSLCREYATVAITKEWPAMTHDSLSPAGFPVVQQMWTTLLRTDVRPGLEQTSLQQAIETLTRMTEHRRIRQLQSRSRIPAILWTILIVGGVATIVASCTYAVDDLRLSAFQVVTLSLLIALMLVAIADIDRPFDGPVHVSAEGFEAARATFDQLISTSR
ncbi:hypothetical protein tb265_46920 [Gemmatimonadetes bacterium T265]|nr:hypothetical protein tb265_46920 [Gemmatimonadetes bacterium T265]